MRCSKCRSKIWPRTAVLELVQGTQRPSIIIRHKERNSVPLGKSKIKTNLTMLTTKAIQVVANLKIKAAILTLVATIRTKRRLTIPMMHTMVTPMISLKTWDQILIINRQMIWTLKCRMAPKKSSTREIECLMNSKWIFCGLDRHQIRTG